MQQKYSKNDLWYHERINNDQINFHNECKFMYDLSKNGIPNENYVNNSSNSYDNSNAYENSNHNCNANDGIKY